jgi:hypothetical protein
MTALVARFFPRTSTEAAAEFQNVPVALFGGLLLLSVAVLVLDKFIPGDWF